MKNIIVEKTEDFAVKIVNLYKFLIANNEFVLSKQLLKSGTSIGANVAEAQYGQSSADFGTKMNIALKESNETLFWLNLLYRTEYLPLSRYEEIVNDAKQIKGLLMRIVKTTFEK